MTTDPELNKLIHEALPATSGHEKGYRDALESITLALTANVHARILRDALLTALDAYTNNSDKQDNDCVQVNLSIKDDEGNVVDGTTAQLSLEQISSIVDQASDLVIAHRSGQPIDEALAALDEALSESNVLGPAEGRVGSASVDLDARIATADDEFASYQFGDDVQVVGSTGWDISDQGCELSNIVYIKNTADTQVDTDSERVSFQVRFDDQGNVSEAYGLLMETGAEIGQRGDSAAKMREAQALTDVRPTADIPRGPRGG